MKKNLKYKLEMHYLEDPQRRKSIPAQNVKKSFSRSFFYISHGKAQVAQNVVYNLKGKFSHGSTHYSREKLFACSKCDKLFSRESIFRTQTQKNHQYILSLILILNNQLEEYWAWSSYWLRHGQNVDIYINF